MSSNAVVRPRPFLVVALLGAGVLGNSRAAAQTPSQEAAAPEPIAPSPPVVPGARAETTVTPPVAPTPASLAPAPEAIAPTPASLAPPPTSAPLADAQPGTAGYHNGRFYIRSPNDVFRLYVQGRVHADWSNQFGPGTSALPAGSGLNSGFYLRRARIELGGEFYQTWQWQLGAEMSSSTSVDNAAATLAQPTCSVDPTTSALTCANRESPVDNPTVKPIPTDVFINYGPSPWANVQIGQQYLPFTLENNVSDNTTQFLERSLPVRAIGAPLQRDIGAMFWGESPNRLVYYSVGLFNGDGPNRPNVDTRYDVAGRAFVRPFATSVEGPTKWAQIGFSAKVGSRDAAKVGYDLPSLTTQAGFAFWKPTYKDSLGRTLHILPSGSQWGVSGDLYLPIGNFDLTGEFVYASDDTREAVDGLQLSPFTERTGTFKAYGWYAEVGYWIFGDHDVIGHPSYGRPIHVDLTKPEKPAVQGLQVVAKVEQLHATYRGAARSGAADAKTPDGDIDVDSVELGLSYWATKHLRVAVNYGLYVFPGSAPTTASAAGGPVQTADQRAIAPAQLLAKGVDTPARDSSHTLNEISARVGVQF